MKIALVVVFWIVLLGGTGYAAYETWVGINDVEISTHGKIALALGVTITFALGAGLMFLVFYSSRRGYDSDDHIQAANSRTTDD
ncbi:MAG: hypothetical protein GKS01_04145 [Alphaproteobacteria bacterium]|nr:hypothetical protein [Alphaproteobacteria bacterium]